MIKKIVLAIAVLVVAAATYAAFRCNFCNGTGFNPAAPAFTCSFCGGKGYR